MFITKSIFVLTIFISLVLTQAYNVVSNTSAPSPLSDFNSFKGNPAGFASKHGRYSTLSMGINNNNEFQSLHLGLQKSWIGLGVNYFDDNNPSQVHVNTIFDLDDDFVMGSRWSYETLNDHNNYFTDIGFMAEPTAFLKMGYYTERLVQSNPTNFLRGAQSFAVGIRPLYFWSGYSDILTTSFEVSTIGYRMDFWENNTQHARLGLALGYIHLEGKINIEDKNDFSVVAALNLSPFSSIGFGTHFDNSANYVNEYSIMSQARSKKQFAVNPFRVIELNLNKTIVDGRVTPMLFEKNPPLGHLDIIDQIDWIAKTKDVKKVLVRLGNARCGFATANAIRDKLIKMKYNSATGGKIEIIVYMESADKLNYYLGSVADKIIMSPSGYFDVRGFSSEVMFYKGLMDKAGIEAQFLKHGNYKSYPEVFTQTQMSEYWKSNMTAMLNSLWTHYVSEISISRGIADTSFINMLSQNALSAKKAKEIGLIDKVMYEDEMLKSLESKLKPLQKLIGYESENTDWSIDRSIALVEIKGAITSGKSQKGGFFSDKSTGSETIVNQLRFARENPEIKGVLININSPGGSALASDVIAREIRLLKTMGKPVIVTISNVCASGGYYIGSQADVIYAQENSIVGSIGIFTGKVILKDLYQKLGLNTETINTTPHADATSMSRKWDSTEVNAIQVYLDEFYDQFVSLVAEGRHIPKDSVELIAQGQIFTGIKSKENRLIDKIGSYEDALNDLKKRIGISTHTKIIPFQFESEDDFWSEPMGTAMKSAGITIPALPLIPFVSGAFTNGMYLLENNYWMLAPELLEMDPGLMK